MVDEKLDLSWKEDLTMAVMNLISAEEHASQSFITSKDEKWLKVLEELRKIRTRWMELLVKEDDKRSQVWCLSKHLLASSMRLSEVSNKLKELQRNDESKKMIVDSGDLLGAFYFINDKEEEPENEEELYLDESYWERAKKGFKMIMNKKNKLINGGKENEKDNK